MERQDRIALWSIVFGLGITITAMALPLAYPDLPVAIYRGVVAIGVLISFAATAFLAYDLGIGRAAREVRKMWPQALMVIGALIFVGGLIAYLRPIVVPAVPPTAHQTSPAPAPEAAPQAKPTPTQPHPAPPVNNKMGDVKDNKGVVTQGQNGDNSQ